MACVSSHKSQGSSPLACNTCVQFVGLKPKGITALAIEVSVFRRRNGEPYHVRPVIGSLPMGIIARHCILGILASLEKVRGLLRGLIVPLIQRLGLGFED